MMKTIILAGGFGTRISEESAFKPKPMLEIGGMPILWHIMKNYSYYRFNEFIICAGYKQHVIKEWFVDYFLHTSDITFDYTNGDSEMIVHNKHIEPWKVSIKINSNWVVEPFGFAYGIIAAEYSDSIRKWMNGKLTYKFAMLLVLLGFLGLAYLKLKPVAVFGDYLLKITLGIAITIFMFEVIAKLRVGNIINNFLGRISYEVYLLHHGVFSLLIIMNSDMNSGVFVITSVAVTVVLAFVLNRLCRPMVRLLR